MIVTKAMRKMIQSQAKYIAYLKSISLFANMPDDELERYVNITQIKAYKKGQLLYLEGDKADYFYIICEGWLRLFHTTEDGIEVSLGMLTVGNTTGENSIFEKGHYTSTAMVVEKATILSIPISFLKEQLDESRQLSLNMLACLVQYQHSHEMQLEQYLLYTAPQRIGCFLLALCPVDKQKDGVKIDLPYDKTLIASNLAMKGATFSRALAILKEETGIQINSSHVTIDSIERLLKFVNGCYSHFYVK